MMNRDSDSDGDGDESRCTYVSSRGLLKSCTVHSDAPISSCGTDTKYLDEWFLTQQDNGNGNGNPPTVYVCSELLAYFVGHLDLIKVKFVLVSGDSDLSIPNEALTPDEYQRLITHPLLVKWFAQNFIGDVTTTVVRLLPIGLDYHTWSHYKSPIEQERTLMQVRNNAAPLINRIFAIYSNVHYRWDRWGDRKRALNAIPVELLVMASRPLPRNKTWHDMAKYQFILSPFGNGFDCHRTWEALALGCIPICCLPPQWPRYTELPILYVNDWSEITPALLKKAITKYHLIKWDMSQLKLGFFLGQK